MTRADLLHRMSMNEFIGWIAFYTIEQEDQKRQMEDAEDQARARTLARQMSGLRY